MLLKQGEKVGPYTLIRRLGRGGFGVVWLAEKQSRIAPIKFALKILLDSEAELDAVKQEAEIWVKVSGHANILSIYEADVYDDLIVIVSQYAPDGNLETWLNDRGGKAPDVRAAGRMIWGILSGLEHIHARNVIHRDLKPANILLQGSVPRIADFGISRVLKTTGNRSSTISGTYQYMAPEAFSGERAPQTDIWSAGVILQRLLTGELPFPQVEPAQVMGAILQGKPVRPPESVPLPLREVIARALQKDPRKRYDSAAEMKRHLKVAAAALNSGGDGGKGVRPGEGALAKTYGVRPTTVAKKRTRDYIALWDNVEDAVAVYELILREGEVLRNEHLGGRQARRAQLAFRLYEEGLLAMANIGDDPMHRSDEDRLYTPVEDPRSPEEVRSYILELGRGRKRR
jgi:serine/threonine protein kinase